MGTIVCTWVLQRGRGHSWAECAGAEGNSGLACYGAAIDGATRSRSKNPSILPLLPWAGVLTRVSVSSRHSEVAVVGRVETRGLRKIN